MQVETFEVVESACESVEQDEEAIKIINEMGLEGQQKLLNNDVGTRSPYRKMLKEEEVVYRALCPRTSSIEDYSDEPIPLRVLQVAAHAKPLYEKVEVWHRQNADVIDPILIGVNGSYSTKEQFLLARWGPELEEFPVLRDRAVEILRAQYVAGLKGMAEKIKAKIAETEHLTDRDFLAGKELPSFYDH